MTDKESFRRGYFAALDLTDSTYGWDWFEEAWAEHLRKMEGQDNGKDI